ncbi:MAG: LuxR C-terminal-related transcriptional regulator [Solimonas sp.]
MPDSQCDAAPEPNRRLADRDLGSHPMHIGETCPDDGLACLSGRELQTFALIVRGRRNKEIALELGISCRTVEHHRRRAYEKLNVRGVAGMVRYAADIGWFARNPGSASGL